MISRSNGRTIGALQKGALGASLLAAGLLATPAASAEDAEYDKRFYINAMTGFVYGDADKLTRGENVGYQFSIGKYLHNRFALEANAYANDLSTHGNTTAAGGGVTFTLDKVEQRGYGVDAIIFPFGQQYGFYGLLGGGKQDARYIASDGTTFDFDATVINYGFGFMKALTEGGAKLRGEVRWRYDIDGFNSSGATYAVNGSNADIDTDSFSDMYLQMGLLLPFGSNSKSPEFPAYSSQPDTRFYLSPMLSLLRADGDRGTDFGYGGQLSLGKRVNDKLNLEGRLFFNQFSDRNAYGEAAFTNFSSWTMFGAAIDLPFYFHRNEEFAPFMVLGFGYASTSGGEQDAAGPDQEGTGPQADFGLGFTKALTAHGTGIRAEVRYRAYYEAQEDLSDAVFNIGLHMPFGQNPNADIDGDGVVVSIDKCPGTPEGAPVKRDGCPKDSDKDGVFDYLDKCPKTKRKDRKNVDAQGCKIAPPPPPDGDKDGVLDGKDKCPGTPPGATVDGDGCQLDSDSDGVADGTDECPDTQEGAAVDKVGCIVPQIIVLKGVHFEFDSNNLTPDAETILDNVVATLKGQESIKAEVAGHTDWKGPTEYNQRLSEQRARSVRQYLVDNGVDGSRLTVRGYGESRPLADNETEKGRAKNRRVELHVLASE